MKRHYLINVTFTTLLSLFFIPITLAGPLVSFENLPLSPGANISGLGTVNRLLDIEPYPQSDHAILLQTGTGPGTFSAPVINPIVNNCLEDANSVRINFPQGGIAHGFGDLTAQVAKVSANFDFSFAPGVTINNFSIKVFDFGDAIFNPGNFHSYVLTAYDANNQVLGTDRFSFTGPSTNRGDACLANSNMTDPGYFQLIITKSGIARLELRFVGDNGSNFTGSDPSVGFDSINFNQDVDINIKSGSDSAPINFCSKGELPVTILGSSVFDVTAINLNSILLTAGDGPGVSPSVIGKANKSSCRIDDVNDDGYPDLACRFSSAQISSSQNQSQAVISGKLNDGTPFSGTENITVVGNCSSAV